MNIFLELKLGDSHVTYNTLKNLYSFIPFPLCSWYWEDTCGHWMGHTPASATCRPELYQTTTGWLGWFWTIIKLSSCMSYLYVPCLRFGITLFWNIVLLGFWVKSPWLKLWKFSWHDDVKIFFLYVETEMPQTITNMWYDMIWYTSFLCVIEPPDWQY